MKKIKRLSIYKKKKSEDNEATHTTEPDSSRVDKQQSAKTKFFSRKRFNRSQSLPENPAPPLEASLNGYIQNDSTTSSVVPATVKTTLLSPCDLLNCCEDEMNEAEQSTFRENCNNNDVISESSNAKHEANGHKDSIFCETNAIDFQTSTDYNDLASSNAIKQTNCDGISRTSSDQEELHQTPTSIQTSYLLYHNSLIREFKRLAQQGWYWGPLSRIEAEEKLAGLSEGSFLVRDSADERYLLSLSFCSFGRTLHTRIEHTSGKFSFYADGDRQSYASVVDLIEDSIQHSQHSGVFCYTRFRAPSSPTLPVRLAHPVSRLSQVRSLQYLCRFVIRQYTRIDHIQELPLPNAMKGYVNQSYF